jgi:hypothetical protein
MLAGLERATWLASYCSAQECLYRENFADNVKYSDLNKAFIENLVDLDVAILKFLIRAHKYYPQRTAGDCSPYNMCDTFHKVFSARVAAATMGLSNSVKELLQTIDDRKGRMEDYASLVHKSSEHPLPILVAESRLSVDFICRCAQRLEDPVGKVGTIFNICV